YYWQVVARKTGLAPSEVSTFSTRSEFHFDWSALTPTQFVGQPFALTIQVLDELNRPVTNFIQASLTGVNAASGDSVLLTPVEVAFINGAWVDVLSVEESVEEMFLRVQGGGITGESSHFAALAPGDISVQLTAPNLVATGENFLYHLRITNTGPSSANG